MRNRTRRQLREWRWVIWFLLIGWWYLLLTVVVWITWELVKLTVLTVNWIVMTISDMKARR